MQEGYRFPSRKNIVTLLREQDAWVVRKAFADAAACEEEATRMEKAAGCGLSVPALLRREGSVLFYTYVDGQTALASIEDKVGGRRIAIDKSCVLIKTGVRCGICRPERFCMLHSSTCPIRVPLIRCPMNCLLSSVRLHVHVHIFCLANDEWIAIDEP